MSDQTVIDVLRVRFDRVDTALAEIDRRLNELTGRARRLERSVADLHVQVAGHSVRMDHLSQAVGRITTRLDLVDTP